MKKRKHKKKKNYYILADIILVILVIAIVIFLFKPFGNNNKEDKEKENDNKKPVKEEVVVKEKTEEEKKLEKLNNINEKIDFFKIEYLDRYLEYKEKHPELDNETIVVYVNIGLDQEFYTNRKDSPNKYTNTILVNKFYYVGEDYIPKNLVKLSSTYSAKETYMEKDAAVAFETMAKAAKSEGYNISAVSTYRSYSYQNGLYTNYANQDGKEKADKYSARPGYSEHQTGLAVDVYNIKSSYTSFGSTKEFEWMKNNAYKYGFILRYTKEYEFITGYMNEPWHYRYVGVDIAKYIQEHPMSYEEYYVRFLDK